MSFQTLIGEIAALWLFGMLAVVGAFWSKRLLPAIALIAAALIIGYLGMTHFHIVSSKTVNGHVQWRFDSNWLFIVELILALVATGYRIWKSTRSNKSPTRP